MHSRVFHFAFSYLEWHGTVSAVFHLHRVLDARGGLDALALVIGHDTKERVGISRGPVGDARRGLVGLFLICSLAVASAV